MMSIYLRNVNPFSNPCVWFGSAFICNNAVLNLFSFLNAKDFNLEKHKYLKYLYSIITIVFFSVVKRNQTITNSFLPWNQYVRVTHFNLRKAWAKNSTL